MFVNVFLEIGMAPCLNLSSFSSLGLDSQFPPLEKQSLVVAPLATIRENEGLGMCFRFTLLAVLLPG